MNKISSGSYKVEDIVGNFSLNLKKGKRVKSSQVHESYFVKSKLNKQMQKSRNGDGKALVLSLFWRKCLQKHVQ